MDPNNLHDGQAKFNLSPGCLRCSMTGGKQLGIVQAPKRIITPFRFGPLGWWPPWPTEQVASIAICIASSMDLWEVESS